MHVDWFLSFTHIHCSKNAGVCSNRQFTYGRKLSNGVLQRKHSYGISLTSCSKLFSLTWLLNTRCFFLLNEMRALLEGDCVRATHRRDVQADAKLEMYRVYRWSDWPQSFHLCVLLCSIFTFSVWIILDAFPLIETESEE